MCNVSSVCAEWFYSQNILKINTWKLHLVLVQYICLTDKYITEHCIRGGILNVQLPLNCTCVLLGCTCTNIGGTTCCVQSVGVLIVETGIVSAFSVYFR